MFTAINKQIRPNKNVDFWSAKTNVPGEYLAYYKEKYIDTKKILSMSTSMSDDGLELTTETQWAAEKFLWEFADDPVIVNNIINPSNDYADKNGIIIKSINKEYNMSTIQGPAPYPNLVIPETWANVEEFGRWWIRSGMPIMFPENAEVFLSDDATAICLFRKGRFQVEMYLIHPNPLVPKHEHPGVEVIKVRLNSKKYPSLSETLHDGESHGAGIRKESEDRGYPLLAIQHWLHRDPTTVASMWKGNTVGPKQESLIRRFNPDAFIENGWADITTKATKATKSAKTTKSSKSSKSTKA